MKYSKIEYLMAAKSSRKYGAHKAVSIYDSKGKKIAVELYLHKTLVCSVDLKNKTFEISDNGWCTCTTHRTLGHYVDYFQSHGYKLTFCHLTDFRWFPYQFCHR